MIGYFIRFDKDGELPITIAEIDSTDFLDTVFNENIINKIGLESLKVEGALYEPSETKVEYLGSVLTEDLKKIRYSQLTMGESEEYIDSLYDETYLIVQDEDIDLTKKYFVEGIEEKKIVEGEKSEYTPLYKVIVNKPQARWFDYETINKCIVKYENDKEMMNLLKNLSVINNVLYFYNILDSTREYQGQKTYLLIVNK